MYLEIVRVFGREILDSRGNPTIEAEVTVLRRSDGKTFTGKAAVPSGASTGKHEAVELRDEDESRYHGAGVLKAIYHINGEIAACLKGRNACKQRNIDTILIELDGTQNKGRLGANAILGVSMANARAAAKASRLPLYRYLGGSNAHCMPVPMMNILNGGAHTSTAVDFQEFMIMPFGASDFREGVTMCSEIYQTLKRILKEKHLATGVGDEGGFAPDVKDAHEVLELICEAVTESGYQIGKDIKFAMDVAASELYNSDTGKYEFPGESRMTGQQVERSTEEMIAYYEKLRKEFPVFSIEDGLDEDDWEGWKHMTEKLGSKVQLVGDDFFVTNTKRIEKGIESKAGNAVLIKVNQIGTITEAMDAIEKTQHAGYQAVISHRSGETEDTFIADLAVAVNAGQIKTGAPCRGERTAKYNRLIRIAESLDLK